MRGPRELASRVAGLEGRMVGTESRTAEIRSGAEELVSALRREFEVLAQRLNTLESELRELRLALEALQDGRAGPAGKGLLDPKLVDKPGKFHGKQSEWRDQRLSFSEVTFRCLSRRSDFQSRERCFRFLAGYVCRW